eukprot:PhF_6_TR12033/c0_g1_i1/m.19329
MLQYNQDAFHFSMRIFVAWNSLQCFSSNSESKTFAQLPGDLSDCTSRQTVCRALRKLNIAFCRDLTNVGIRGVEAIPKLEELRLAHTNISDQSCFDVVI